MPVTTTQLTTLVELWSRRSAPESYDIVRALNLAKELEAGSAVAPAVLSLAYRLVQDIHAAVGWQLPRSVGLPRCKSARASVRHTCSLLVEQVSSQLVSSDGEVALLGALGVSQSLFGCWDSLPAQGELLVRLDDDCVDHHPSSVFALRNVRWIGAGALPESARDHLRPAVLRDRTVFVPSPEMVAAQTDGSSPEPVDLEGLVFCAAAHQATHADRWGLVLDLAKELERGRTPVETAMKLGITDWLGLSIGPVARLSVTLRGFLGKTRTALFSM